MSRFRTKQFSEKCPCLFCLPHCRRLSFCGSTSAVFWSPLAPRARRQYRWEPSGGRLALLCGGGRWAGNRPAASDGNERLPQDPGKPFCWR
jgi:hypothetical protein